MNSGKTNNAAQLQLSPSTALISYHGVTNPHDVSSGKNDDLDQRHDINDGGTLADCAAYTSAENDFLPPTDSGKIDTSIAMAHDEAFREWLRLDQEQAEINDEEFRLKQELEDREYQAKIDRLEFERRRRRTKEKIEHSKRLEI